MTYLTSLDIEDATQLNLKDKGNMIQDLLSLSLPVQPMTITLIKILCY